MDYRNAKGGTDLRNTMNRAVCIEMHEKTCVKKDAFKIIQVPVGSGEKRDGKRFQSHRTLETRCAEELSKGKLEKVSWGKGDR
jgi:hypothetical protein